MSEAKTIFVTTTPEVGEHLYRLLAREGYTLRSIPSRFCEFPSFVVQGPADLEARMKTSRDNTGELAESVSREWRIGTVEM